METRAWKKLTVVGDEKAKGDKMKVVINTQDEAYFNLSKKAIRAYLKRKGKKCYFYGGDPEKMRKGKMVIVRYSDDDPSHYAMVYTKDYGDSPKIDDFKEEDSFSYFNIERNDPDLVAVVEELGKDADVSDWDDDTKLKIVDIPDDVKWYIAEWNGVETVEETHRSWS